MELGLKLLVMNSGQSVILYKSLSITLYSNQTHMSCLRVESVNRYVVTIMKQIYCNMEFQKTMFISAISNTRDS